ncbi:MAG: hypothetical protein AAFY72_09505 [Cyanobacteria bacterium J06649_4]
MSFGSVSHSTTGAANSYSDSLMDDLFGDVDRILEGDLSACMTFVKPRKTTVNPTTRTVQLPSNFSPRNAIDIYNATVSQRPVPPAISQTGQPTNRAAYAYSTQGTRPQRATGYRNGGRPITSFQAHAAQSGNFQSSVIQSHGNTYNSAGTTTVEVRPVSTSLYPEQPLSELNLSEVSPRSPQTIFEPQTSQQPVSLPFLLMGAASISVASTLGLWTVGQSAPGGGWLPSFSTEASAAEIPNSDKDFLAYLQLSLDNISANQRASNQNVAVIPVSAPAAQLPTTVPNVNPAPAVGALPNLPGTTSRAPNVIERVFVPVYENAQKSNQAVAAQPSAPLPAVAVPSRNTAKPTVPVPAPVAAAAAIPPGAPATATPSVPIVQNGSNTALPTPSVTAVAPTNSAVTQLSDVTPESELVLVGVLNLGSRSAALFDIDGSSQRAYVGDRIGLSDWTLVSVNGQDVVIRRNGEVRSVYIGQRF